MIPVEGAPIQNNSYQSKKTNAPTLDDTYENQIKSKVKNADREVEGEIQHESLKKRLEEQRLNGRVEFVAQDPAQLIKQMQTKEDDVLGRLERVEIDDAQIERGFYNEQEKPKKKKKKRHTVAAPDNQIQEVGEDGFENIGGNYLDQQDPIPAVQKRKTEFQSETTDPQSKLTENDAEGDAEKKHK